MAHSRPGAHEHFTMTTKTLSPVLRAILMGLFIIAYVGWVAFYLIVFRPLVLAWVFQHLGWTSFPGLLHLFLILLPFIAFGVINGVIRNISGTVKGRPYS